jgi:hypothetical protein
LEGFKENKSTAPDVSKNNRPKKTPVKDSIADLD